MNNKDVPLKSIKEDRLGVENHVNALSNFIRDAEMPITIAIQGEWGSGKTSFMHMLESSLCSGNIPKRERFSSIWINAWELFLERDYEGSVRKLILNILNQIGSNFESVRKKNVRSAYFERAKETLRTTATVFLDAYKGIDPENSGRLMDLILPEKNRSISQAKNEFEKFLVKQVEADNGITNKGFLIFIDDLDRLEPRMAVVLLEAVKNLFDIDKCIFIVSIDYEVVSAGVRRKYGNLEGKTRNLEKDFFDKLVQLPYVIPMRYYDISGMVMDSLRSINFLEDSSKYSQYQTLIEEIVELSTRKNPRAIKRLLNMMQLLLAIQRDKPGVMQPPVRVLELALLAIQLHFPDIYAAIAAEKDLKKWRKTGEEMVPGLEPADAEKRHYQIDSEWKEVLFAETRKTKALQNGYGRVLRLMEIYEHLREICKKAGLDIGEAFGMVNAVFTDNDDTSAILYSGVDYDRSSDTQYRQGTRLINETDVSGHHRVFDAGCGNGVTTIELWKKNPSMLIDAVDISESQIRMASNHYYEILPEMKDADGAIDFDVMDLVDMNISNRYDLVFSNATLHWMPDPRAAYTQLYEALIPGGELAVHQGGKGTYQGLHDIAREAADNIGIGSKFENFEFPAFYPSAEEMEEMLSEIGFRNIRVDVDRSDGSDNQNLVDNFAHASLIFYKGAGLTDDEYSQLETEYFRLCSEEEVDRTTVRLYIHAYK